MTRFRFVLLVCEEEILLLNECVSRNGVCLALTSWRKQEEWFERRFERSKSREKQEEKQGEKQEACSKLGKKKGGHIYFDTTVKA